MDVGTQQDYKTASLKTVLFVSPAVSPALEHVFEGFMPNVWQSGSKSPCLAGSVRRCVLQSFTIRPGWTCSWA